MEITKEYEDGLKLMEELTTNAQQIQEQHWNFRRPAEPVTVGTYNQRAVYYFTLLGSLMNEKLYCIQFGFGDLDKTGKRLQLLFAKTGSETACGLKATTVLTNNNQSMFCQLLLGLIHRDEVVSVDSTFATVVLRAIKFLEQYYGELSSDIRKGRISDWVNDPGCRNIVTSIVKPNPKLADSIENLCGCKSWEGLKEYSKSGGLPLVSTGYICSEAICGINLVPLSKPFEIQFNAKPVDLVNVKPGHYYELLVTTYGDKISELDLLNEVNEAKTHLDPLGFILRWYTSHVDASSIPGHYVVFWELKAKEGNDNIVELDRTTMTECCSRMEESLDFIYRLYRKENAIAALEMKVLKH
ncbi:hypothetical protein Gotur_002430 [Gossypium turneri]